MSFPRRTSVLALAALLAVALVGCGKASNATRPPSSAAPSSASPSGSAAPATNLYAADNPSNYAPQTKGAKYLVYVPNTDSGDVTVIDPTTYKVLYTFKTGREPQHVVPSWDLKTLYATNDLGNSLTPIDPDTGKPSGANIHVDDPYNLYFTPDGKSALVMAESDQDIDFRDPHTFALQTRLHLGKACAGVDHLDFSADGSYFIATCEFAGQLVKVDTATRKVVGYLNLGADAGPQDIKIDPQGRTWYVADFDHNGVWKITGDPFKVTGFVPTGLETHGLYPSRDGRFLYISNRGGTEIPGAQFHAHTGDDGSVSVLDFATQKVVATWTIPGGGTPDMGNVSGDGRTLWLSGRRSDVVYAFDTATGKLVAKIPVGSGPHGLCVWPLPGTYSLGHTGILR